MKTPGNPKHDKATKFILKLLTNLRMKFLADAYATHSMVFNFMLVGASGMFLSWILFSLVFRVVFISIPAVGEFIAYAVTTLCTFLWNFYWNKKWALNIRAQLNKLNSRELAEVQEAVAGLLHQKEGNEPKA